MYLMIGMEACSAYMIIVMMLMAEDWIAAVSSIFFMVYVVYFYFFVQGLMDVLPPEQLHWFQLDNYTGFEIQ